MYTSRAQTSVIRIASFPDVAGPDKMYGGHRMSSTNAVLPPPDLNQREHGKDDLSGETYRSEERAVAAKLIHE